MVVNFCMWWQQQQTQPTKIKLEYFVRNAFVHQKKLPKESGNLVFEEMLPLSNLPAEVCYDFATRLSGEKCGQFCKQMSSINTKATLGYSSPTPTSDNWPKKQNKNNEYYMCGFFLFLFICTFSLIFPLGCLWGHLFMFTMR
jgi:hypothetical protein